MGFEKYVPLDAALDVSLDADLHRWLAHLDLAFYRDHAHGGGESDLKHLSDRDLTLHFLQRGFLEGRPYNRHFFAFLDPRHYADRYPELALADDFQAMRHWMYRGVFEGRIPNKMTQDLLDADIHLFQMGKVASKSIESALVRAGHRRLIPHLHWASEIVQTYTESFLPYDQILNRDPCKELVFISGVRDPLERVVSGLFQSASEKKSSLGLEDLTALFTGPREQREAFLMPHLQRVLDWFSHGYFRGIDVYEHAFDVARGHACLRKGPVTVFLYRLDALDRCWAPLSELIGLELRPASINEAQSKGYADQMRQALQVVRSAQHSSLLDAVHGSRYWQHFFAGGSRTTAHGLPPSVSGHPMPLSDAPPRPAVPLPLPMPSPVPPQRTLSGAPARALAGQWVRLDVRVRTALRPPPACHLRLDAEAHARAVSRALPLQLDAAGHVRFFFRMPEACRQIALEPRDAGADFHVLHFSIRPCAFWRVLVDVLYFEWEAGPRNLARKLWRALRAARIHGWASCGRFFLDNLERNGAGYGFAVVPHARMSMPLAPPLHGS